MYSKMLLVNQTLGQDNLLFFGLNVTHTDFTGLNIRFSGHTCMLITKTINIPGITQILLHKTLDTRKSFLIESVRLTVSNTFHKSYIIKLILCANVMYD